jgi:hypothetical protein
VSSSTLMDVASNLLSWIKIASKLLASNLLASNLLVAYTWINFFSDVFQIFFSSGLFTRVHEKTAVPTFLFRPTLVHSGQPTPLLYRQSHEQEFSTTSRVVSSWKWSLFVFGRQTKYSLSLWSLSESTAAAVNVDRAGKRNTRVVEEALSPPTTGPGCLSLLRWWYSVVTGMDGEIQMTWHETTTKGCRDAPVRYRYS